MISTLFLSGNVFLKGSLKMKSVSTLNTLTVLQYSDKRLNAAQLANNEK